MLLRGPFPVVVPAQAALTQAIAAHGMVDVACLDSMPKKAGWGRKCAWGASGPKAVLAIFDDVAIREAAICFDHDGVLVRSSVPALETEQACVTRW
jgi:hypothetical protein